MEPGEKAALPKEKEERQEDSPVIHVLLIEDNPADARFIKELFALSKTRVFSVIQESTLSAGIDRLTHESFTIIITDLGLPDSLGLATIKTLFENAPGVPIIVLTGLHDEETANEAVRAGVQDYLVKGEFESILLERSVRYAIERKRWDKNREQLIKELKDALARIKVLSGMLPICAHCKNIRNDKGYWETLETYLRQHTEADFTHGICPDCIRKMYPEIIDDMTEKL